MPGSRKQSRRRQKCRSVSSVMGSRICRKYNKVRSRSLHQREYDRLTEIVPSLSARRLKKRHITKVRVIEETINYIDELHRVLALRLQGPPGLPSTAWELTMHALRHLHRLIHAADSTTVSGSSDAVEARSAKETFAMKIVPHVLLSSSSPTSGTSSSSVSPSVAAAATTTTAMTTTKALSNVLMTTASKECCEKLTTKLTPVCDINETTVVSRQNINVVVTLA